MSWLVFSSCGLSVGLLVYVLLIQPAIPAPSHGIRGLKRLRARSQGSFAQLEPWLRWLAARIVPLLSERSSDKLAKEITIAGEVWGLCPAEMRALSLWSGLGGTAAAMLLVYAFDGTWLYVPLFGSLALVLPGLQLSSTAHKRVRNIQRRIPHVVDMLVLSLGAGLDFTGALRQVVERAADPSSDAMEELGLVLEELKLGHTRPRVLAELAERAPCDEVRDLVAATIQAEEQGTPLAIVLQTQASTSRQRRSTRAEEVASKASTALVLPLVLVFAALMILIIGPTALEAARQTAAIRGM